jgi:hypothetical protein
MRSEMIKIKTALDDEWIVFEGTVTSSNTEMTLGYNEEIKGFLDKAVTDLRYAQRMRLIEEAPIGLNGKHLLLPDREHPGWSRPISLKTPQLDWRVGDHIQKILIKTDDHSLSAVYFADEPGESDDCWEMSRFIPEEQMYGPIGVVDTFDQVQEFAGRGFFPEPLPPLTQEATRLIELKDGYSAEAVRRPEPDGDGGLRQEFLVSVTGPSGAFEGQFTTNITTLIQMRDDSETLQQMLSIDPEEKADLENLKKDRQTHNLFRDIPVSSPMSLQEMKDKLSSLKVGNMLHLETAEKEYEILVGWKPVTSIRTPEGQALYIGNEIAPANLFDNWHVDSVVYGKERSYEVLVKRPEGSLISSVEGITLNADTLVHLTTNAKLFESILKDARDTVKFPVYEPIEQDLLCRALKGTSFHIEYIQKNDVSPREMQKRIEKQYLKSEESYLKMGS